MNARAAATLVLALACAAFAAEAGAATYKWVDKDGKVHYSDQPVAGAEKVELKPLTEVPSTPLPEGAPSDEPPPEPLDSATSYTSMTITSPQHDQTIRGAGVSLAITVDLSPSLGGGDRIEYLLDGKVVERTVPNVERGTHTVGARVVDPDGRVKIEATPVTVHVFQNIASQPQQTQPKPKKP